MIKWVVLLRPTNCDIDNSLNKVYPMLAENGLHGKCRWENNVPCFRFILQLCNCLHWYRRLKLGRWKKRRRRKINYWWVLRHRPICTGISINAIVVIVFVWKCVRQPVARHTCYRIYVILTVRAVFLRRCCRHRAPRCSIPCHPWHRVSKPLKSQPRKGSATVCGNHVVPSFCEDLVVPRKAPVSSTLVSSA